MSNVTQASIIKQFNDEVRPKFNEQLFKRSEDEIIEELKNVILSCQKDYGPYILKVENFAVVDNYIEIMEILYNYEEDANRGVKRKKRINPYQYINLKDSDIKLLIVNYFMKVGEKESRLRVLIAVPRIVDRYYFRISGNLYSATLQIVDGSIYNNSTSVATKNKTPNVTLKTIFMPLRVYKNTYTIKDVSGLELPVTYYVANVFTKSISAFKYILAKYGIYDTFKFSGLSGIYLSDKPSDNEFEYSFMKNNIYINVPKYVYDNDSVTQSLVFTIYTSITKDTTLEKLFTNQFWIESLGKEFKSENVEKGYFVLSSLEGIYDISTMNKIRLPLEDKQNVYSILLWIMREFQSLKSRDILDLSTKRIRFGEYLASLYATKLSTGIYRLSDVGNKVTIESIRKVLNIRPTKLLEDICKCNLVNYRNLVNDLDSITALKYTLKGISGLGSNKNQVPIAFKMLHPSQLGRIDLDSSSKSDPGMSGVLCPLGQTDGDSFSAFTEPNEWRQQYQEVINHYRSIVGMKEVIEFKRDILNIPDKDNELEGLYEAANVVSNLISPIQKINDIVECEGMPLEEGGIIYYGE